MPPPDDGNQYTPFEDLIRVEHVGEDTYRSIALPFSPGGQLPNAIARSYGGHVYAQSAWAACQTVDAGFLLYNVTGYFHLPGSRTTPFIYHVKKIRDGRSFASREVSVMIEGDATGPVFTSTCSFKKTEPSILDVQEPVDLWKVYGASLRNKRPGHFEEVPGVDVPWFWKLRKETGLNDEFPGLDMRKADMTAYNKDRHPLERKGLIFYRGIGHLPPDANLHLCAHLYASDRNSLYIVTNQLDVGDLYTQMSSLVHQTSFHSNIENLMFGPSMSDDGPMDDISESGRWYCKEDTTVRVANGRATLHGRLFASNGAHIATVTQDGMIRFAKKPYPTTKELAMIREREMRWPPRGKL